MKNHNFPNHDVEILSLEDEKIRTMIGNLKRIDAPKNFDFRLKARIAGTASANVHPRFLPALRYVLPLSTILVIFAFVILNGLYFPDNQVVSQISEDIPQTPIAQNSQPIMPTEPAANVSDFDKGLIVENPLTLPKQSQPKKDVKPQFAAVKSPATNPKKNSIINIKERNGGGGSRDSALSVPPINHKPKGMNLISPNTVTLKPLNAQEILSQIGIEAVFTDAGFNVKSVRQEVLDVKVGDVIEAIDGEKLTDKLLFTKADVLKKLMILRGTEKIEISLPANK